MTLEEFNYIAEIIASIAVIASLIYVGLQIRQNTAVTQATGRQAYVDSMNEYVGLINLSPNLADILHRGATGLSNIKGGEIIQFGAFLDQCFVNFETSYFQWKAGVLDARLWSTFRHTIVDLLIQPGQQQWWDNRRHWFDKEFQEYVNQVLVSEEAKPMHPFSVEPSKAT
jgi:hypothetical protein